MQSVKHFYAGIMHVVAELGPSRKLIDKARACDAYGWRRWGASLLAIHDVKRMMALELPWWNVSATREVDEYLSSRRDMRVFEYGSGASTAWLARRAGTVVSVEHHSDWHGLITPMVAGQKNASLWHRDLSAGYVEAIDEAGGKFDLIVIDGRRRIECLARAIPHLSTGGIVLFDDSGRRRYRSGIEGCGLKERRYFGRSYCVPYPDFTSILHD